jgi:ABC-type multidrug transport system fused ATPase/permease subunit
LEDTLESRNQTTGRPIDETMTVEVLKEFGSPKKVAASYLPPRYLIGPRLYPTFMLVLKIILGIAALVIVVTTSVSTAQQAVSIQTAIKIISQGLAEGVGTLLSILGNIVFIFALIEWGMARARTENDKGDGWDPRSLTGKNDSDNFKYWERIPEIVFGLTLLLAFNFYPQWIGMYFTEPGTGNWIILPFLSQAFFQYLPWLNILWLAGVALNFALLRIGKWQTWSRWFQIGMDVFTMVLFIVMASGNSIVEFSAPKMNQLGEFGSSLFQMQQPINYGVHALLILLVFLTGVDLVQSLIKMARKK